MKLNMFAAVLLLLVFFAFSFGWQFGLIATLCWVVIWLRIDSNHSKQRQRDSKIAFEQNLSKFREQIKPVDVKLMEQIALCKQEILREEADEKFKIEERESERRKYLEEIFLSNDKLEKYKAELNTLGGEIENEFKLEFSLTQKNDDYERNSGIMRVGSKKYIEIWKNIDSRMGNDTGAYAHIKYNTEAYAKFCEKYNRLKVKPPPYEEKEFLKSAKKKIKQIRDKIKKTKDKIKVEFDKQKDKEKLKEKQARIKGYEGDSRDVAKTVRIRKTENCPYCGNSLGSNPHKDHISPMAKGGLSTKKNMIWVCKDCNLQKSALTLNQFIKKYDLDRDFIEANLEELKKDF